MIIPVADRETYVGAITPQFSMVVVMSVVEYGHENNEED
jgi:hypothetical protein